MTTSEMQRQYVLAFLQKHRHRDPTFWAAVAYEWPKLMWTGLLLALGVGAAYAVSLELGLVILGASIGLLAAHLGQILGRIRVFRVYKTLVDWDRIDHLAKGERGA